MVRPGVKTAVICLTSLVIAQTLAEVDWLTDPWTVYKIAAVVKDIMMILPEAWEEFGNNMLERVQGRVRGLWGGRPARWEQTLP